MTPIQQLSVFIFIGIPILATLTIIAYDIRVLITTGEDATISEAIRKLTHQAPIFPFFVGLFIGLLIGTLAAHFWWNK